MRNIISFLRSMRFGMVLLAVLLLLSLPGSLIPQGNDAQWYVSHYRTFHPVIMALGLDHIFSTWYFIALVGMLCANLTLCNIIRVGKVRRQEQRLLTSAAVWPTQITLSLELRNTLTDYLQAARFRPVEMPSAVVWIKNRLGFYGSFLTHLSILLVLVMGGAVLYCSDVQDYTILPDEILTLSDGTTLAVDDFHIEDETGRLDYASHITITAPDGTVDAMTELRVNHPHSFRGRKYYQQTYGTCGLISVQDSAGGEDHFFLTETCFLSADGRTGIWYEALYPGYIQDENGDYTLISSTSGVYVEPVYQILVCGEEGHTPVLAFPGESITLGEYTYTFHAPASYPGIRVKTLPPAMMGFLYVAFAMLIAALWLCFFHVPTVVTLRDDGYALLSGRGGALELATVLGAEYVPWTGLERPYAPEKHTENGAEPESKEDMT